MVEGALILFYLVGTLVGAATFNGGEYGIYKMSMFSFPLRGPLSTSTIKEFDKISFYISCLLGVRTHQ